MSTTLLDPIDDDLPDHPQIDAGWWDDAVHALRSFLTQSGKCEFTCSEFRQWAEYYCCLDDPHQSEPWSHLFRYASVAGLIRRVGSARNRQSAAVGRWAAA